MVEIGDRVESLNCGWMEALSKGNSNMDKVQVRFDLTENIKNNVLVKAFVTGNVADIKSVDEGDILKSTSDGLFKIIKYRSNRSSDIMFLDSGNIVEGIQKVNLLTGYINDQVAKAQATAEKNQENIKRIRQRELEEKERLRKFAVVEDLRWKKRQARIKKAKEIADEAEASRQRRSDIKQSYADNSEKALALVEVDVTPKFNPNDCNFDFKDRHGKWVLRWKVPGTNQFVQTRLGRLHNNMTQRANASGNNTSRDKAYNNTTISEEFKDPQKFCDWAVKQVGWDYGFQLDKDLLSECKEYSAENCTFVPHEINQAIIKRGTKTVTRLASGGYEVYYRIGCTKVFLGCFDTEDIAVEACLKHREAYVKCLAKIYKNYISDATYEALMKWLSV